MTFEQLERSFYRAARGKRDRGEVLDFYANVESNCLKIKNDLLNGTFRWGNYRAFYVEDPKRRLIEAAPFRDRVVHHALFEILSPIFEPTFYAHSYACRKGYGSLRAMTRLYSWIQSHPGWNYLQMDVSKFFPSIDQAILYELIAKKIRDPKLLAFIKTLLYNAPHPCGIPIGNLTSQLFANLYLNPLDQFVKRELQVPLYIRYMDDFILLDQNVERLYEWRKRIEDFGHEKLHLGFHPHKVSIGPVKDGVSFIGYRMHPWHLAIRGKNFRRFKKKLRQRLTLDHKVKRLLSYRGHVKHVTKSKIVYEKLKQAAFGGDLFQT